MVKKYIGQNIMTKKINVFELSEGLESVIIEAIAKAIGGKVRQYIIENKCIEAIKANSIQHGDRLGPWWHVRCLIDFERLLLPIERNPFEFYCNREEAKTMVQISAKEFCVMPYSNGASYVHNYHLDGTKEDLIKEAILYVATNIYKLLLREV